MEGRGGYDPEVSLFFWLEAHNWCQLPYAGGIYDQPAWIWEKLQLIRIYKHEWDKEQEVRRAITGESAPPPVDEDDMAYLAGLPDGVGERR